MPDPYLAQIAAFGFDFVPENWARCDGKLLPIAGYQALFSLLQTTYGGDGTVNFALPDLSGRVPLGWGQGTGSNTYLLGEKGGKETVSLNQSNVPAHSHNLIATTNPGSTKTAKDALLAKSMSGGKIAAYVGDYLSTAAPNAQLSMYALSMWGDGDYRATHNNMQPYLSLNFCICIKGQYPSRP